ncbi:MAG: flagellar basal body rod protein FlgC [Candidatus Xenobia bacterium]
MRHLTWLLVVCFAALIGAGLAQDVGELPRQMLQARKQAMRQEHGHLVIDLSDRKRSRANLLAVRQALLLQRRVLDDNVRLGNTTNTVTGQPYTCHELVVGGDGQVRTIAVPWRYVYDPTNPNALSRGTRKGYVAVSGIDITRERAHLQEARRELRVVDGLLGQL